MNELNTTQRGTIDGEDNLALTNGFVCTSDNEEVATTANPGGYWYVYAQSEGTALITATRISDGATGTMEVTVTEAPGGGGTFLIHLGSLSPK